MEFQVSNITNESDVAKKDLRSGYATFLQTLSGKDLVKQFELLEKAYVLSAIRKETIEGKAIELSKLEGLIQIRDYIFRMSKPSGK